MILEDTLVISTGKFFLFCFRWLTDETYQTGDLYLPGIVISDEKNLRLLQASHSSPAAGVFFSCAW